MSLGFVVSRIRPEDAELVVPLFDAYRIFYGQDPDPELAREFLRERLLQEESVVLVALEGPTGIGFTRNCSRSFHVLEAWEEWEPPKIRHR